MMNHQQPSRRRLAVPTATLLLLAAASLVQSCAKDDLEGQPSWLGNSIYERLQNAGDYTYTLRLIDDLAYKQVLSQTGSKTLFVADDNAYNTFFKTNSWGVRSYDGLTLAQKKLLFNSSMVNNAYLVELLSDVSGNPPEEGQCMRRETAASVYDSVPRIYPSQMPATAYWNKYRSKAGGMLLMRDNTTKPMIHFLPVYMQTNHITDADLTKLTNGASNSTADAWVNGKKIVDRDITCKNGYIQKVDGVMTASDNMAQIIRNHPNMSMFSSMLDRFCAPYYSDEATKNYDRLYNSTDSVFALRYFAQNSQGKELNTDPEGKTVDAELYFDPGWNQYIYSNTSGKDFHYDAGAMLVPSDKAMADWWNHDGKVLQDKYGTLANVPLKVIVKLLNINMLNSFSETVPSKFDAVVDNTTKTSLGLKAADVDSCFMGCNGVVYLLNKVFTPADYSSVSFPALVNQETMSIIYWAISNLNFEPYLNSMDSYYSFFIPTNNAMLEYIDPCSYAGGQRVLYRFFYNDEKKTVGAHRFYINPETGNVDTGRTLADASAEQVQNRLTDLLNNLIVVGNVEDGHTYYKTKGGAPLRVAHAGQTGTMTVAGGYQIDNGKTLVVSKIFDQSKGGNGKAYVMDNAMPMTSERSAYSILKDNSAYSEFFSLLSGSKLLSSSLNNTYSCVDKNITLFDAFNYTIYVPTNASIRQLIDKGCLPTWDDYAALTADDFGGDRTALEKARKKVEEIITDFLRYHVQDNAVFVGATPVSGVKYETSKINPANKRFFSVTVSAGDEGITLRDQMGDQRKVVTTPGLYNTVGREYWFESATNMKSNELYNASDVVIHQIDGPLFYDSDQLKPWREVVGLTSAAKKFHHAQTRRR